MLDHAIQLEDLEELPADLRKGAHTPAVDTPFEWDTTDEDQD
ncbi:MAG: hypothetical protein ACRDRP_12065 [Pseudonocardiaceae bacterium]